MGSHESGVEGQNHIPQLASNTSLDAAQDAIGFLGPLPPIGLPSLWGYPGSAWAPDLAPVHPTMPLSLFPGSALALCPLKRPSHPTAIKSLFSKSHLSPDLCCSGARMPLGGWLPSGHGGQDWPCWVCPATSQVLPPAPALGTHLGAGHGPQSLPELPLVVTVSHRTAAVPSHGPH